ncbi:TlpA family protein disulfide reductase [Cryomorphaceae bacterium]|nr:TlpA family protein disulfide reductase [Cryomorphaceae bacterium]
MKISSYVSTMATAFLIISCAPQGTEDIKVTGAQLEVLFHDWWTYHNENLVLSAEFEALDEDGGTITKEAFLEALTTEVYIPLERESPSDKPFYQLYRLGPKADSDIGPTMANEAQTFLQYFRLEGTQFPDFSFTDLDGMTYTKEGTKGQVLVLKTWFINCGACIAEFPDLNEFVEQNEDGKDLLFISLATDRAPALEEFLIGREFAYTVVPEAGPFIRKIGLRIYPTHIIVDGDGVILKVVNKASEMMAFLEGLELAG